MVERTQFKKTILLLMNDTHFKKNGASWYLDGKDNLIVVNYQRSMWGEFYYVNIGIWLKGIQSTEFPKYNECPIEIHAENLFPEHRETILKGCSLDQEERWFDEYAALWKSVFSPFLEECTIEHRVKQLFREGKLQKALLRAGIAEYLSKD